jgi:hypothetical protein
MTCCLDQQGADEVLFAYGINYRVDLQAPIILDVEVTPACRNAGVDATKTMLERAQACRDPLMRRSHSFSRFLLALPLARLRATPRYLPLPSKARATERQRRMIKCPAVYELG